MSKSPKAQATKTIVNIDTISAGKSLVEQKFEPDQLDNAENVAVLNAAIRAITDRINTDTGLRSGYANKVFKYLCVYLLFCGAAIVFQAFGIWGFKLPGDVLVTLVGSTAVSAIGLVGFVVAGLFRPVSLKKMLDVED